MVERKLRQSYFDVRDEIKRGLDGFKKLWQTGGDDEIFAELVFCMLTPQSKAKVCWRAVENLIRKGLLIKGSESEIAHELVGVRFNRKKAEYIVGARKQFMVDGKVSIKARIAQFDNPFDAREWLVHNIRGIGYKEASHFLRNIGRGEEFAILDRHILRSLKALDVIEEIPRTLSKSRYLEIEAKMRGFAEKIDIPMGELDLLLWYMGTGEVFK